MAQLRALQPASKGTPIVLLHALMHALLHNKQDCGLKHESGTVFWHMGSMLSARFLIPAI